MTRTTLTFDLSRTRLWQKLKCLLFGHGVITPTKSDRTEHGQCDCCKRLIWTCDVLDEWHIDSERERKLLYPR